MFSIYLKIFLCMMVFLDYFVVKSCLIKKIASFLNKTIYF